MELFIGITIQTWDFVKAIGNSHVRHPRLSKHTNSLLETRIWPIWNPAMLFPINFYWEFKACSPKKNNAAALLQVPVAKRKGKLTLASVKEVRPAAASHLQYMKMKTKTMRWLKGIRREMMKKVKAIKYEVETRLSFVYIFFNAHYR